MYAHPSYLDDFKRDPGANAVDEDKLQNVLYSQGFKMCQLRNEIKLLRRSKAFLERILLGFLVVVLLGVTILSLAAVDCTDL